MAKSTIYAALEIGTSKICVVVGEAKRDGSIKILGIGQAASRGVRKGEIVDFDKVQTCLNDALVRAEDRSDVMIRTVFLGVSGAHIESQNNRGCHRLPEGQTEIIDHDVEEAKDIARNVPIPEDNVFLHSVLRQYIVDGVEAVREFIRAAAIPGTQADAEAAADRALVSVLGTTRAQLLSDWQARLQELAEEG